jgi:hypothetical protein
MALDALVIVVVALSVLLVLVLVGGFRASDAAESRWRDASIELESERQRLAQESEILFQERQRLAQATPGAPTMFNIAGGEGFQFADNTQHVEIHPPAPDTRTTGKRPKKS